ncbi:TonB-dependent receptor [Ravibacter arvi]|uniref:TonB-dependent receptor n=2 Tax=Ravibacter arvi TaxID=2051041 RepID=A0ABP8M8A2_9BACT
MQLTVIQLVIAITFCGVSLGHVSKAQEVLSQKISLEVEGAELRKILSQIEKQAKVKFVYSSQSIQVQQRASLTAIDRSLSNVLDQLLNPLHVQYEVLDSRILLRKRAFDKTGEATAAKIAFMDREVRGVVKDETGVGLPGVSVVIKGTQQGTITGSDGDYQLNVPDGTATLVFSFVGFVTKEIVVANQTRVDVSLTVDNKSLEEVVVVGYGEQKKVNLTGAVATVGSEVIQSRPVGNLGQALQGTIANLNVSQSSGALGGGTAFNIRGNTSLNGGGPLILVNNIPMDVNQLNPNDIESVTVLKDAASAAIYGARAAFGVVLITTKSGKKDTRPQVSLSMNYSVNTPVVKFETMDAMERMTYMNEANNRVNGRPYYQFDEYYEAAIRAHYNDPSQPETFQHPNEGPNVYAFSANTNWPKILLRDNYPMQQYNATISGGSDRFDYYTSVGYFKARGITRNFDEKFSRYNVMSNLNYDLAKWMRVGAKISVNASNKHYPPNDNVNNFDENRNMFQVHQWANWPVYLPDGKYASLGSVPNVVQMHKEGGYRDRDVFDAWMTGLVKLTPIKNVSFNLDYSFNFKDTLEVDYRRRLPMYDRAGLSGYYPYTNPSSVQRTNKNNRYYVFNAYADYANTFAEKHYLKVMVGFNQENASNRLYSARREKLIVETMPFMNLAYGERFANDGQTEYAIRGAFGRLNYSYADKYLLEFNGRYDGSSKFPKRDRFAFFPSISLGWRLDNENFLSGIRNTFNLLKLRGSVGNLGNQNIDGMGYYPYIATYGAGLGGYLLSGDNQMAVYAPGLVSPNLTWETVTQKNIGIDFAVLENRLNATFDVYQRDTKDMLTKSVTLPAVLAVGEPRANAADLRTRGFDLTLNWNDQVGKVRYGVTLLLSDYKARITRFSNPAGLIADHYVGRNIGEIWGLETGGIFQTDEEAAKLDQSQIAGRKREAGDLWFVDQNGDGKITRGKQTLDDHGDMKIIGNNTPRYSYGFRGNLSWKGFDLDIFFQGVAKRDMQIAGNYFVGQYNDEWSVQGKVGTDWWSPTNRDAYFPRPLITGGTDVTTTQTRYLQNAAYLRLKQLTLGYTIPAIITEKLGMKRMQLYFSGNNMWEATKMIRIADPEQSSAMSYPLNRAFSVGANIGF